MQEFVLIVLLIAAGATQPTSATTAVFTSADRCRDAAQELQAARDQKFPGVQMLTTCARR